MFLALVILFIARFSFGATGTLPMVSTSQLKLGNHWIWTYYTEGDLSKPYSAERYQVIDARGPSITFEISSRYGEQGEFVPNTRFKVDLLKCHHAFRDPELKMNFMIELYPKVDGEWIKDPILTKATAFEEKFNCNPIVHSKRNSLYQTRFESAQTGTGTEQLFQQWPKAATAQLRSYYYLDHPGLAGVAFRKEFNPGTPYYYEMRLTGESTH